MGRIREKNLIVYKTLKRFGNKEYVDFHMPGHKSGQMIPSYLKKNLFKIDTTELSFSDNLDHPKDLLKDLLDDISNEYNSKKSYLLVNGATQGILASITGCVGRNDKIIIARDCHISVFSALEICGAVPTFTEGTNSINDIVCTYEKNKDSKVIFFTSPNYYGKCAETEKIIKFAHENGMYLHMDGARLANASVSLEIGFKEFTADAGVDVLSFGLTKNGAINAEAIIFFDKKLAENFKYYRKQGMQLGSKMRFMAVQFEAILSNDIWKKNAAHANQMAKLLADKIAEIPQIKITQEVEANGVFAIVPAEIIPKLQEEFFFYMWDEHRSEVRWMTSFDTTEEDIEQFVSLIKKLLDLT